MSRSVWKPLYSNLELDKFLQKTKNKNTIIKTFVRNIKITSKIVGYTFMIYNGNSFRKLIIQTNMIGHKLGEFSPTRKKPSLKKKKKKKR